MNKEYIVRLTEAEREQLEKIVSKGKAAAYKIKHANVLLRTGAFRGIAFLTVVSTALVALAADVRAENSLVLHTRDRPETSGVRPPGPVVHKTVDWDDFKQPAFRTMLANAVFWAMDRPVAKK